MGVENDLGAAILKLLASRRPDASICPSEAARAVAGDERFGDLMEMTRTVASRLAADGQIEVTQGGTPVDLAAGTVRGPIRLRLRAAQAPDQRPPPPRAEP